MLHPASSSLIEIVWICAPAFILPLSLQNHCPSTWWTRDQITYRWDSYYMHNMFERQVNSDWSTARWRCDWDSDADQSCIWSAPLFNMGDSWDAFLALLKILNSGSQSFENIDGRSSEHGRWSPRAITCGRSNLHSSMGWERQGKCRPVRRHASCRWAAPGLQAAGSTHSPVSRSTVIFLPFMVIMILVKPRRPKFLEMFF